MISFNLPRFIQFIGIENLTKLLYIINTNCLIPLNSYFINFKPVQKIFILIIYLPKNKKDLIKK